MEPGSRMVSIFLRGGGGAVLCSEWRLERLLKKVISVASRTREVRRRDTVHSGHRGRAQMLDVSVAFRGSRCWMPCRRAPVRELRGA